MPKRKIEQDHLEDKRIKKTYDYVLFWKRLTALIESIKKKEENNMSGNI